MSLEEKKAAELVHKAEDTASDLVATASDVADTLLKNAADRDKLLLSLLNQHFTEDKENFSEIRKNQKRYEELLQIDGEHMSFIRKDITVLTKMMEEQNRHLARQDENSGAHREKIEDHMKRVEPMIQKYERNKIAAEVNTKTGGQLIKWFLAISGVIGAFWIIKDFLIKIIKLE